MNATSERSGLSLRSRVAIGSALLVALPVAAAVLAAAIFGDRIADRTVADSLSRAGAVRERFQTQRAEQLALISRVFSSDPAFSGYVAEAVGSGLDSEPGVDRLSIVDLLTERRAELGFDFAIVLDPHGRVLARTDRPAAEGENLSDHPLVGSVLDDLVPATGLWASGERLYQASVNPLASHLDLIGFLVTGLSIDDRLAIDMAHVSGTEVIFLARREDGTAAVLASSLDLGRSESILATLRSSQPDRSILSITEGLDVRHLEVEVGGERLVGRLDPLSDRSGRTLGALVALTSFDRQLLAFGAIRRVVLGVGVLSMVVAAALSFVYVRRALGPVRRLAAAAEGAARGEFGQDLELPETDELRRTARAFNKLLGDLRAQREMGAYISDIARHLPDPVSIVPPPLPSMGADPRPSEEPTPDLAAGGSIERPSAGWMAPGSLVGDRYEVIAILGHGGMGVVYKARDRKLGELAALKVLHPRLRAFPDHLELLKSEIKLARKISHPNVLRTFDYGEHETIPYISMEYVRGLTLHYLLRQTHRIPYAAGLYLARQLCEGLGAAHGVDVLHRDIKPSNLILDSRGNAKLMDFGIAAPIRRDSSDGGGQSLFGTPAYLAPELYAGGHYSLRSDVYSVGVLMYEVFAGTSMFPARSFAELSRLKQAAPARPSSHWREIPPRLEEIILRCTDIDPERRYESAGALGADLMSLRS